MNFSVTENEFLEQYQLLVNKLKDLAKSNKKLQKNCLAILDDAIKDLSNTDYEIHSPLEISSGPEPLIDSENETFGSLNESSSSEFDGSASFKAQLEEVYRKTPSINGIVAEYPVSTNIHSVLGVIKVPFSNSTTTENPNDCNEFQGEPSQMDSSETSGQHLVDQSEAMIHSQNDKVGVMAAQNLNRSADSSIEPVSKDEVVLPKKTRRGRQEKSEVSSVMETRSKNSKKHSENQLETTIHSKNDKVGVMDAQNSNRFADSSIEQISDDNVIAQKGSRRGRPNRSAVLTVVGTRRKYLKISPFFLLEESQQRVQMIYWILPKAGAVNTIEGSYKIQAKDIAVIRDSFLDDNVNIKLLKEQFEPSAFEQFKSRIKDEKTRAKNGKNVFSCAECHRALSEKSVCCQFCLLRYDFDCSGLTKNIRSNSHWYCKTCKKIFRS